MIGRHMMSVVPVARVSLSKICLVRRIQVFPPWSVQSSVRWFMFLPVRLQVQEPSLIPVPVPAPAALPAVGLPRIRVVLLPVPAVVRLPVRVVRAVLLPVPAQAQAMMPLQILAQAAESGLHHVPAEGVRVPAWQAVPHLPISSLRLRSVRTGNPVVLRQQLRVEAGAVEQERVEEPSEMSLLRIRLVLFRSRIS